MSSSSFIQLIAACVGIVGSLFFAIGVMRQTIEAMARLSGTYWDWNPHILLALAAQKADYLFGGGLILVAFVLQLGSFFGSGAPLINEEQARFAPWLAAVVTIFSFFLLRMIAGRLAKHYEAQISALLERKAVQNAAT